MFFPKKTWYFVHTQSAKCFTHTHKMYLIGASYVFNCISPFRVTANLSTFVVDFKSHSKNINS